MIAVISGALMAVGSTTAVGASEPSADPAADTPADRVLVVDRDAAVVDVDGDGSPDWFRWGESNTHLPVGERVNHPGQVFTPRLEWDLDVNDVARIVDSRVIAEIEQGTEFRRPGLRIMIGDTPISVVGPEIDITAEVRAWAVENPVGGTFTIDVTGGYPVRTREFDLNHAARLRLVPESQERLRIDQIIPIDGCSRYSCSSNLWGPAGRVHFFVDLDAAMRPTLGAAERIELAIRLVDCDETVRLFGRPERNDRARIGNIRTPLPRDAVVLADDVAALPVENGLRYVDITDFVQSNIDAAAGFRFDPSGNSCTVLLGANGRAVPSHVPYEPGLAIDGHRYDAELTVISRRGDLAACSAIVDPQTRIPRVTWSAADDVDAELYRSLPGSRTTGSTRLPEGTWLDFSSGSFSEIARYTVVAERGDKTELIRCGTVPLTVTELTSELIGIAEEQSRSVRQIRLDGGATIAFRLGFGNDTAIYDLESGQLVAGVEGAAPNPFSRLEQILVEVGADDGRRFFSLDASGLFEGDRLFFTDDPDDRNDADVRSEFVRSQRSSGFWRLATDD